jgi:hypothetical protein
VSTPAPARIEPETAERFASAFVPAWQFDDAPFSAGTPLSPEEIQALDAGGGAVSARVDLSALASPIDEELTASDLEPPIFVAIGGDPEEVEALTPQEEPPAPVSAVRRVSVAPDPSANAALSTDPVPPPRRSDPVRAEPSVVISDDLIREVMALSARVSSAEQEADEALPTPGLDDTGVFRAPRSSKRLVVGGAVAAILGVLGFLLVRAEAPAQPAPSSVAPPSAHAVEPIPVAPPLPPRPSDVTATAVSATPATQAPAPPIPARSALPPAPLPPRQATTTPPTRSQESPRPRTPPKSPPKPAGGGIIRDNPF